jgi:hypothetical protein
MLQRIKALRDDLPKVGLTPVLQASSGLGLELQGSGFRVQGSAQGAATPRVAPR